MKQLFSTFTNKNGKLKQFLFLPPDRKPRVSARTFAQYATHGVGGGLGWGGDDDVPCTCTHGRCYASHGVGRGGVGVMTFLALATLTWHAWSMLRNRWWGGVGCNSIVDLARMVNATQQMVGGCGV